MTGFRNAAPGRPSDSVAGLRFLVVDDHKFSRHIAFEALKWLKATMITEAADATEAIELLRRTQASNGRDTAVVDTFAKGMLLSDDRIFRMGVFDCVITDFNMRPLNGLHLLKAIRTGEAHCARDTPVLLLTGFSDEPVISAALALDVDAYVMKPFSRKMFSEKLQRVLMRPVTLQDVHAYQSVKVPELDDQMTFPVTDGGRTT
jgi:CheY-like chemotaxis protein